MLKGGGEPAARRDLRMQKVLARMTGTYVERVFENDDMRRGRELEPEARLAYSAESGELVEETGYIRHNDLMVGCSLDGHIGDFDGIVEIKVPREANHFECWKSKAVPDRYRAQLAHGLWITGAQYAEFVSYGGQAFPPDMRLAIVRVPRASIDLKEHEKKALAFLAEVERDVEAAMTLRDMAGQMKAAVNA